MEIVFFKSKEKPDYYLLYKGKNGVNAEKMLRKLTNTGEFENSGFEKIEIELGKILKTGLNGDFFQFLIEKVSTNHIVHPTYNDETFKAWYEFKDYKPEKWLEEFEAYQNSKIQQLIADIRQGFQTSLF